MPNKATSSKSSSDNANNPHPVDVHVGQRLRLQRTLRGLTQSELAEALGITFQQIQKYEKGSNRISASRLYEISRYLGVPVAYFFEDLHEPTTNVDQGLQPGAQIIMSNAPGGKSLANAAMDRSTVRVIKAFFGIKDAKTRADIYQLLKTLAENSNG